MTWSHCHGNRVGDEVSVRKITISGLEKNERIILKAAIQTASGFETGLWEFPDDNSAAQAIILDQNSQEGGEIVADYADQDDAPLLIGIKSLEIEQPLELRFMIEPPLNYNTVLATLRQIDSLVKNPVEDGPVNDSQEDTPEEDQNSEEQNELDVPVEEAMEIEEISETEEQIPEVSDVVLIHKENSEPDNTRLHHLINKVVSENKSVEISHPDFPSIKVCSEKHWFIFSGDLALQEDIFRKSVSEFTVEEKGDEIRKQAFSGSFPKALWELIYTATLVGTEGELLLPLLSEDQLHLIELPEFQLAPHSDEHVVIADYLISRSATVREVASDLELETSTVIDFCNACQSIGLLIATGSPQNRLFNLINRIVEQKKSVEITHPDFPTLDICSEKNWFIFPEDLNKQSEMFSADVGEFSFENRGDEIRKQAFSGSFPKSLWELVYTATMYGTEGKLLAPLQATDRLSLISQPAFDYVNHTEEQIMLADHMTSSSETVHDIAVNTGVDLKSVIDFSNMCQAD